MHGGTNEADVAQLISALSQLTSNPSLQQGGYDPMVDDTELERETRAYLEALERQEEARAAPVLQQHADLAATADDRGMPNTHELPVIQSHDAFLRNQYGRGTVRQNAKSTTRRLSGVRACVQLALFAKVTLCASYHCTSDF